MSPPPTGSSEERIGLAAAIAAAIIYGAAYPATAVVTIAFGSSASGNLLLMASVRRVPAGRASGALLLTPVASAVIAAVVLGERLTPMWLVGAACILVGMALERVLLMRPGRPTSPG